jgi:hypothetical protein
MSAAKTSKNANQAKAPQCAAFVEDMRKAFGADQVTVLWVKEGDFEIGKPVAR